MTITIDHIEYSLVIEGADITAQSLTHELIYMNGANKLKEEADRAFENPYFEDRYTQSEWETKYIDDHIERYVIENKARARRRNYFLN